MFYILVMLVPRMEEDASSLPQSSAFWLGCVYQVAGGGVEQRARSPLVVSC